MMERYLTEHGFVAVDNDPNVSYDKKFYYGKAEDLGVDHKYIMGCKQAWQGSEKHYHDLLTGKLKKKIENTARLSERGSFKKKLSECAPPEDLN